MLVRIEAEIRRTLKKVPGKAYPKPRGIATLLALGLLVTSSCNPFAPGLEQVRIDRQSLLGNRTTINGFFDYFRNSYELKDTSLYGQMLDHKFEFSYKDFSTGNQGKWDRDQEMRIATNMFRQIRSANLVWTWFLAADTANADTLARVERYFNLTVVLDDQNVYTGTGSAKLTLVRPDTLAPWRIRDWQDVRDM